MEKLTVRMLGEFSLSAGDICLNDTNKRTRKMWNLLAYLICHRKETVPQKRILDLLYGDEPDRVNPENALRITMHRLRATLDVLWPGAGKELLLHREGGYCWNPQARAEVDFETFDALAIPTGDPDRDLDRWLEALGLYGGEFLPRHGDVDWVGPVAVHYHNRFVQLTMDAARLLLDRGRSREAADICRRAAQAELYHEPLYQLLIRALAASGDSQGAEGVYQTLKKRLFDHFGIVPSRETLAAYREAVHTPQDKSLPMEEVLSQLREPEPKRGALICDYDYFKVLCFTESRSMERSGHATHVALLSVTAAGGEPLPARSRGRVLDQLGEHIRLNLRRGDTAARCTVTQYIVMLPGANYENSCMVCRRVISAFHNAHPRSNVRIHYMVQPLTPQLSELSLP